MVYFLMETRLDKEGLEKFCGDLPFPNKIVVKLPNSGGGLALMWKRAVQMELINYTANHILMKVREEDGQEWFSPTSTGDLKLANMVSLGLYSII